MRVRSDDFRFRLIIHNWKNYYEWDMNRQGLSWKAKLKFAIDQVIKQSDNFEDFLQKCSESGIEIDYNPNHKIDLKFRMKGQQKWSRAKTLGWYYESKQIVRRIDMYKGVALFGILNDGQTIFFAYFV